MSNYLETEENIYEILNHVKIDLIISDLNYRNGNVSNLFKKFKKNKTEIPIIIFTSESNESKSIDLLKSGAYGFITKNLKKRSIRNIIQDIAFSIYGNKEINKFTRLKNKFNFDYNT